MRSAPHAPRKRNYRSALHVAGFVGISLALASATVVNAKPSRSAAGTPKSGASKAPTTPDDGLGPHDVYLEGDIMVDSRPANTVTAQGHVEARYQGRTLRADKVVYQSQTGAVQAYGHVLILNADGTMEAADEMELDDQFRAGVALGFSARLQNNASIVANAAIRRNESVNVLHEGRFTPCNICRANGSPQEPTISIEADTITEDRDRQVIYYRHAVIRVKGFPILALPFFWHADPMAERRSGFLAPKIEYLKRRGLSYEQPYLLVLSPSANLIVDPQINTAVNPLFNLRYTERFYSGLLDVRAGYTLEKLFDSDGKYGTDTNRSYVLAKGAWQLNPNLTVGFGAEDVTDPTFFARYGLHQIYASRGPFTTDTSRLINQLYATRQDSDSYLSIAALSYDSLRATQVGVGDQRTIQSYDTNSAFPIVGPLLELRYDPKDPVLGGRLRVLASAVVLTRDNTVISVTDPAGINPAGPQPFVTTIIPAVTTTVPITPAVVIPPVRPTNAPSFTYRGSRQATVEGDWRSDIDSTLGLRISPFAEARADIYSTSSGTLSYGPNYALTKAADGTVTRGTGTIGADVSWPFIHPLGSGSLVLEPLAQVALSPRSKPNPNVPNEDSASFEFDETNLFSIHRFPGYDLYEGGARLDIGGRATADFGGGRSASVLVGRVFRDQRDPVFTAVSGLQGTSSDWITSITVTPIPGVSFFNRARNDADTWKVHREEAGVNLSFGRTNFTARYRYDENGVSQIECTTTLCASPFGGVVVNGSTVIGKVSSLEFYGSTYITEHWGVEISAGRDLETKIWPVTQLGVFYQDECVRLDVLYTHDEIYKSAIGETNAITFRVSLSSFGRTFSAGQPVSDGR